MPGLITPPTRPTVAPNVTAEIGTIGGYSLNAGQTLYATSLWRMFEPSDFDTNATSFVLTNAGTIWNEFESSQVLYLMNWGSIENSGTIVAHATVGDAETLFVTSSFTGGLQNSGSIYALSDEGNAIAFAFWSGVEVHNSGTIAALGTIGATAISAANGGEVFNELGGEILAEGRFARAVGLTGESHLVNHGRIEARTTDPGNASVAVLSSHLAHQSMQIDNHGLIRADVAIYSDPFWYSPPQHSRDQITNHDDGVIEGAIFLSLGDDQIINQGQISGYVDMGEGDDLFDNSLGQHVGNAEMGWGNDLYRGGAGVDAVTGDRGDDTLHGDAGNDLILGGWGADLLDGGAGNDGLYGEGGDDRIIASGGDTIDAGDGDDRIELIDYRFASIEGGAGHDVLGLPAGMGILDLSRVAASGRVVGFEEIALAHDGRIVVHVSDIDVIAGGTMLRISAATSGIVDLAGNWTAGGRQSIDGVSYRAYSSGGATVLIENGVTVNSGSSPSDARGLDAVASGNRAPMPGAVPGAEFTWNFVEDPGLSLNSSLEIFEAERWVSSTGAALISSIVPEASLINHGTLESTGGENGAAAIVGYNYYDLHNHGSISAAAFSGTENLEYNRHMLETYGLSNMVSNGVGNAHGVYLGGSAQNFLNTGDIHAATDQSIAAGYVTYGEPGENTGTIQATSTHHVAVGVHAHNGGVLINSGNIRAEGEWGAFGVQSSTHAFMLINSGVIEAYTSHESRDAIALSFDSALWTQTVINSGRIEGEIAVQAIGTVNGNSVWLENYGQIVGRIEFGVSRNGGPARSDVIINGGLVDGSVSLGAGSDVYDGQRGTQIGIVHGNDGNDLLVGTLRSDSLEGGAGDDVLLGGGGDTLTGGAGGDTFVFTAIAAGRTERITDFVSGTDRIDLRALAPTSVAINGSTVTAVTSSGTLTISVSGAVSEDDIVTGSETIGSRTAGDDVLVGGAGGVTLHGGDGLDLLVGGAGNDRLDGGPGVPGIDDGDLMWGGDGDDIYVVDAGADLVVEHEDGGTDTVQATQGLYAFTYVLPSHVEHFTGGSGIGNSLANSMTGSSGGDTLEGGGGDDLISGLGGGDQLRGGGGADRFLFTTASLASGEAIDEILDFEHGVDWIDFSALDPGGLSFHHGAGWIGSSYTDVTIQHAGHAITIRIHGYVDHGDFGTQFQAVKGSAKDDSLEGRSGSDWLEGGSGDDWMKGGAGSDTLKGGSGSDGLVGGAGEDILLGGDGADRFYLDGLGTSTDRIGDFAADDRIYLDAATFSLLPEGSLSAAAFANAGSDTPATRIIYNAHSGEIWYLPTGRTSGEQLIAVVQAGAEVTAESFVIYSGSPQVEQVVRARLILTESGQDVDIGGDVSVVGTRDGGETITLLRGDILLDASFNAGGDTIILPDDAAAYTASLSGSSATLTNGDMTVAIPVGSAGLTLQFDDAARTLRVDPDSGSVVLGDQAIGSVPVAVDPATGIEFDPAVISGPDTMARLILTETGQDLDIGGNVSIIGTRGGGEIINALHGDLRLDSSFNAGGDRVVLPGQAGSYTVSLAGSFVTIANGDLRIALPVGDVGLDVAFDNGVVVLRADTGTGQVMLGDQILSSVGKPVDEAQFGAASSMKAGPASTAGDAGSVPGGDDDQLFVPGMDALRARNVQSVEDDIVSKLSILEVHDSFCFG